MRMNLSKVKMLQVSKCLIGLAVMMLQSCDVADNRRDVQRTGTTDGYADRSCYSHGGYRYLS